jgi:hypothetical protein
LEAFNVTVWDNPVLAIFAVLAVIFVGCSLFLLVSNFLRNPRPFFAGVGILAAAAVGFIAISAILAGGVLLYSYIEDQVTLKKCLTAHERRASADAAPDDYFGRQLRDAAAAEAKTCAELAAKKETEAKKASGLVK